MTDIRSFLASETSVLHRRADARASAFNLATSAGFTEFLIFMWLGSAPVETELTRAGAGDILEEWPQRMRAKQLEAELGGAPEVRPFPLSFRGEAEIWGAFYVLEGSRLGARMLASTTPFAAQSAFFLTAAECRFWPRFVELLRDADRRLAERDSILAGARKAFSAFLGQDYSVICADLDGTSEPAGDRAIYGNQR